MEMELLILQMKRLKVKLLLSSDWFSHNRRHANKSPSSFQSVVRAMECVFFLLVRSSTKCCFSHTSKRLRIVPSEYWPIFVEQLESMNFGRLLRRVQYSFHRKLYALYLTKHSFTWWIVKQIITSVWSDLTDHFMGNVTSRLCASTTNMLALSDVIQGWRQNQNHYAQGCIWEIVHTKLERGDPYSTSCCWFTRQAFQIRYTQNVMMVPEHLMQSVETEHRIKAPVQLTTLTRLI